jgi:hypothetical protein
VPRDRFCSDMPHREWGNVVQRSGRIETSTAVGGPAKRKLAGIEDLRRPVASSLDLNYISFLMLVMVFGLQWSLLHGKGINK